MKQRYQDFKFQRSSLALISTMNGIIEKYMSQGFVLTVRQLYYQLVSHHDYANSLANYKRMASIVNDARIAGLMDWNAIEDRTRSFARRGNWENGKQLLDACAEQFHMDMWYDQDTRPVVIVEKEALEGVMDRACHDLDIHLLAARGYPSVTVLRNFAKYTMIPAAREGQRFAFLHFGDHDPSGIDMSRDLEERLSLFSQGQVDFEFHRLALNMDQIEEYTPPENPAKSQDARFQSYVERFGESSWELDALDPSVLIDLVRTNVEQYIDQDKWDERKQEIKDVRERMRVVAKDFE